MTKTTLTTEAPIAEEAPAATTMTTMMMTEEDMDDKNDHGEEVEEEERDLGLDLAVEVAQITPLSRTWVTRTKMRREPKR